MGNLKREWFALARIDRVVELRVVSPIDGAGDLEFDVHRRFPVVQGHRDDLVTTAFDTVG